MGLFCKPWVLNRKDQNPNLCSPFLCLDNFLAIACLWWMLRGEVYNVLRKHVFSLSHVYLVFWVWTELLEKAKSQVNLLKKQNKKLAKVVGGCLGQYYSCKGSNHTSFGFVLLFWEVIPWNWCTIWFIWILWRSNHRKSESQISLMCSKKF